MKRLIVLLLCLCTLLTSCSSNRKIYSELNFWDYAFRSDDYVCCTVLDKIVTSIEANDKELLLSLFSENAKAECQSLEEQAEALFNYCSGKLISFGEFRGLPNTFSDYREGELVKESHIPTYDINTSDGSYRLTFEYVEVDLNNTTNEGILSLYVIYAEDDIDLNYAYRMSGEYIPGIHIGVIDLEYEYE